jgi:hypothetical protein
MPENQPILPATEARPVQIFISVITSFAAGAFGGAVLWIIVLHLRLGTRNIVPHYGRMVGAMTETIGFGATLIVLVSAINGLAQTVTVVMHNRPAVSYQRLILLAILVDLLLLLLTALMLDHHILFLGAEVSVFFHWAIVAMISSRRHRRFSQIDAAYIVMGAVINLVAARFLVSWIEATR